MGVPRACSQCGGRNMKPTGVVRDSRSWIRKRVEIACLDCQHAWFSVALSVQPTGRLRDVSTTNTANNA